MKPIKKKDFIKLREALAAAYHGKEKTEVGDQWQFRVMGHISSLGPPYSEMSFFELFQRLLWRLAPVACVLALLLGAGVAQLDFISDYELAKMFIEDPADFSLLSLYRR